MLARNDKATRYDSLTKLFLVIAILALSGLSLIEFQANQELSRQIGSLQRQISSIDNNLTSFYQLLSTQSSILGVNNSKIIATGLTVDFWRTSGPVHRIVSFVASYPGRIGAQSVVSFGNGILSLTEGTTSLNLTELVDGRPSYVSAPILPGNVTLAFIYQPQGCSTPQSCPLLPVTGNFTITYYY